ncbi:MAG: ribonuclease D [Saccharospirillum sp.]
MNRTDHWQWITTDAELAEVCPLWQQAAAIMVDTEFMRTDTYFAQLGLIQVALQERVWLIDPLAIEHWQPLVTVLEDETVIKVLHALSEDAEVLSNALVAKLAGLFDTQIAAALLGMDQQMGFARLVESELGVTLPKEVTRSNWLQRPLSDEQCRYAADDVYYLHQVFIGLATRLHTQQRFDWVVEDSNRVARDSLPSDPQRYYLKLRGAWKLKGSRLYCLQQLAAWREQEACRANVNRSRVLSDAEVIQVAQSMPSNLPALKGIKDLHPRKIRLYGEAIVELVARAGEASRELWPERVPGPLPSDQAALYQAVKARVAAVADRHGVPVEVLARRKQLEQLVRSGCYSGEYEIPEPMTGWRRPLLAEPLMQLLMESPNDHQG